MAALLLLLLPRAGQGRIMPPPPSRAVDSLRHLLARPLPDTSRVVLLCQLSDQLWTQRTDSAAVYAYKALALARRVHYRHGEGEALNRLGAALRESNLARALEVFQKSLRIAEVTHDRALAAQNLRSIGIIYVYLRDQRQGLAYYFRALKIGEELRDERRVVIELSNIGLAYDLFNQLDSSRIFQERAYALARRLRTPTNYILYGLGNVARKQGRTAQAKAFYRASITESKKVQHLRSLNFAYVGLATLYQQQGRLDSSVYYARLGCQAAQTNGFLRGVLNASTLLTQDFKTRGNADSALKYQSLMLVMKDTLFGQEKVMRLQNLNYREQQRAQEAAAGQARLKARYRTYGLVAGLVALLALALLLARHARQQERAREALEQSLAELKTAQDQLVQREKMAFLGELTAGIAHELQNPLNFVKNFAEVSTDLVDEITGEHRDPTRSTGLEQEILTGLKQNLQQISQHGQRATSIIKGMLEHSRAGTSQRVPTNLNAVVEDSLRLAYQGLRTKDKEFTAELVTELAPGLPRIEAMSQDLGRVLINLFTNAFHAVQQRQRQSPDPGYRPTVTVSTHAVPGAVEIQVKDNGTGMSDGVKEKIFQPFFTTKPVGEGTGLGLSLSHDIVTTGHGGTLTVESREGEGTEFVVRLPAQGGPGLPLAPTLTPQN
ncbi:ATP-binding protein [Hymenobacter sp. 5317J-9]|uniref:tetratricopeptide repeat-containing sensor histidine kinase n=1 Tax=Hymenobacter sp. 5317J-9 TaxID=2932250 RepID=UPI001FD6FF3F|nr:ATP-binding protein [Hymenobacter sp. 5317J-9]UOQ98585.1 ATP-binding protein [Hymenobacter sp. 5317J-9]